MANSRRGCNASAGNTQVNRLNGGCKRAGWSVGYLETVIRETRAALSQPAFGFRGRRL